MFENDNRIVMTLDAGGTNLAFSAIQGNREIIPAITLPARHDSLEGCLQTIIAGFKQVQKCLSNEAVAISFAFPGPADYERGVIGDLPNFPFFRGGVALKSMLENEFHLPVFINNDGNLFAFGEALCGFLPEVNRQLQANGNPKQYKNLLGITLGTGFGGGVVINGTLLTGDNGCGGDVWLGRNKKYANLIAEESISIRAVKRVYGENGGENADVLTPQDIFEIAEGVKQGNREAACKSFEELGEMLGNAIAQALNIVDGLVVIGGGLIGAAKYIIPAAIKELHSLLYTSAGDPISITQLGIYNLTDEHDMLRFMQNESTHVKVPFSTQEVMYMQQKKSGIGITHLGTNKAVSLGAYAFALSELDKMSL